MKHASLGEDRLARSRTLFRPRRRYARRGATLAIALATLLAVTLVAATVVRSVLAAHRQAQVMQNELQAQWLAECAVQRAAARLAKETGYEGETWQPVISTPPGADSGDKADTADESSEAANRGVAIVKVIRPEEPDAGETRHVRIEVRAHFPDHAWRRVAVSRTYDLPSPVQPAIDAPASDRAAIPE